MSDNPFLQMADISKAFPGVQALDRASLDVEAGEIHGLVGENGAGKSTIIKVLAGVYAPDSGTVSLDGETLPVADPGAIHRAGVRFIHQELNLVPHFTVAETVFMGQEITGVLGVRKRHMKRLAEEFLRDSLNHALPGNRLIRDLGVAERKLVQIARALIDNKARVVVFDEPTGPLASGEVVQLFKAIESLRARGIAIIYVSHYLGEITDLCDRVTVFRNGTDVAVLDDDAANDSQAIIQHMVGRDIGSLYPQRSPPGKHPIFDARGLQCRPFFSSIDLRVHRGEIVGIAGLVGSGREELVDALYGLRRLQAGSIELDGESIVNTDPHTAVEHGVVLIPRDRRNTGLVLDMTVADNINLASLEEVSTLKVTRHARATGRAAKLIEKLDIRPANAQAVVRFLSGGNQQKVVLARWLATGSRLFIMDEPTIGVDIGAKVEIYQRIADLAADNTPDGQSQSAGVVVSSSDPAELLGVCDRILVLFRGSVVADKPVSQLTLDSLLALTTGGSAIDRQAIAAGGVND